MATEEVKLTKQVHDEALGAGVSDKKKGGKFQPFKKLFGKRKKKVASSSREALGKKSHCPPRSASNGTFSSDEESVADSLRSFKCPMGSRAFSHDSIFIPDGGAESEQTVQAMSQDNILGKVQTLQQQLGKNIKFGQRPANALPVRKADGGEASLEEGPLLPRPVETLTPRDVVLSDTENKAGHTPGSPGAVNPPGGGSDMEEKVAPVKPSRPKRHFSSAGTIESVNLDAIPLAIARLDNSAAKHKLAVKPKNQRVSKKHRRLAREAPDERDGLESEPGRQQNGHPGEEQHAWLPGSEEQQRHQEDYWRELEAKCKRQKAEAAEKRRLEEQRLQALERRLWEENRRQELWEEEGEAAEGRAERLQLAAEPVQPGPAQLEEGEGPAAGAQRQLQEEAWQLEQLGQGEELETQRRQEADRLQLQEEEELEAERRRLQEEEARQLEQLRQEEELEAQRKEAERLRLQEEEARQLEQLRLQEELEAQRKEAERLQLQEEARRLEQLRLQEELEAQRKEAERLQLQEEARRLEQLRQEEELEAQRKEAERLQLQEEARRLEQLRQEEELEGQRRREAEKQQQLQEEARRLQQLRQEEQLEAQRKEAERLQQLQEEEDKRLEQLGQQEELEAQRRQEAERLQLQEEARRLEQLRQEEQLEAQRRREAERQQLQEEAQRLEQLRQQEEPAADREPGEAPPRPEEERPPQPEDSRGPPSPRGDLGEKREERENPEERKPEAEPANQRPRGSPDSRSEEGRTQRAQVHLEGAAGEEDAAAPEKGRRVEELRWQEVDERQSMPRPYTFQVSSGGRQILFPKVNLSPVTPARDTGQSLAPQEPRAPPASRALPAALSVPHTAILVTGAQLCGPAVNLSQIKDSACKSLLGLSEDRKHGDVAASPPRAPSDPRQGSAKTRPPQERPGSGAALAEWASIRSRILRASEGEARGDREPARPGDEAPRGSQRRPAPPGAKFSIKPAWQKFSDGGADGPRPSVEAESTRKRPAPGPPPAAAAAPEPRKSPEKPGAPPEPADATEGCKFAKDLPSFLVPSPPYPGLKAAAHAEAAATWSSEAARDIAKPEPATPAGEEKASPFGIKLRRTNYSLRFHCDQQAEQKKKKRRSSTGDGAEGAQPAAPSPGADAEAQGAALQRGPAQPPERRPAQVARREAAGSHPAPETQAGASPAPEQDKAATRMPLAQKPALAPKPASQTPPSSPRSKLSRPYLVELLARRAGRPEPEPRAPSQVGQESSDRGPSPPPPDERKGPKREEEEEGAPQRNPASPPALTAPQEQLSQAPEAERREKPALQSRHSLEGPRLAEKAETAQPLWITLALQKQKGFREQQATREERKQAREAKQAAKLSKENVSGSPQPGSSGVSRAGSLHVSTTPPEENKPETAVCRLERREQLKKASTLPTSVTVEISDAAPPAPLVKEVTKRFSTPDATPASTEPAWLALAKRKAKAWSDCPQIIK